MVGVPKTSRFIIALPVHDRWEFVNQNREALMADLTLIAKLIEKLRSEAEYYRCIAMGRSQELGMVKLLNSAADTIAADRKELRECKDDLVASQQTLGDCIAIMEEFDPFMDAPRLLEYTADLAGQIEIARKHYKGGE
jgi:hypothetical protein